jgi:hypothetical protein
MSRFHINIVHPEWLAYSNPGRTLQLFHQGKLPQSVAGWMLVVSLTRPLRAIYGSDFLAALALLWRSIHSMIYTRYLRLKWSIFGYHEDEHEHQEEADDGLAP